MRSITSVTCLSRNYICGKFFYLLLGCASQSSMLEIHFYKSILLIVKLFPWKGIRLWNITEPISDFSLLPWQVQIIILGIHLAISSFGCCTSCTFGCSHLAEDLEQHKKYKWVSLGCWNLESLFWFSLVWFITAVCSCTTFFTCVFYHQIIHYSVATFSIVHRSSSVLSFVFIEASAYKIAPCTLHVWHQTYVFSSTIEKNIGSKEHILLVVGAGLTMEFLYEEKPN